MSECVSSVNRESTTIDVVRWCKDMALPAKLVGRWVWIEFASKPAADVREGLKNAGFRWVKNRGAWAHSCGVPSRRGSAHPFFTYGAVPVDALALDAERGVA
jgi:hypothetical protein